MFNSVCEIAKRAIKEPIPKKILAAGSFNFSDPGLVLASRGIRLNSNGTEDTGFSIGLGFNSEVRSFAIQSDGKILFVGNFTSYNGTAANRIIRLNSNGSIDTGFSIGTGFNNYVNSVAIQSDGKILVGGIFTTYNGTASSRIIRLNSDGSIDTGFSIGTGFNSEVRSFAIQSDGKILVGGQFTSYKGTTRNRIIRLNSDGTEDTGFSIGTGFSSTANNLSIQSDGKILVCGFFTTYNGTASNRIIRLNSDGSIDTGFSIGTGFNSEVRSFAIQSDGKILVGGVFTSYNGTARNRIIRLNSNGTNDTTFSIGSGFNFDVNSFAIQSDGKILVGGGFSSYNGTARNRIIRLNSNGTNDTALSIGLGFNSTVRSIAIQSDGKILVGGQFTSYKGTTRNRVMRLNSDGTNDTVFNTSTMNSSVLSLGIQSTGKILVGGQFSIPRQRIMRLNNSNGSIDTGFFSSLNNTVYSLAIQSDDKIVVGGIFTRVGTANRIIRLNSNGGTDTGFNVGTGFDNTVFSVAIQSDGKVLAGGNFVSYNGTARNRIIRLNSDGSIDTGFNMGTGCNSNVRVFAIQSDGKILAGGFFSTYNGTARNRIMRLNSDGSIDTGFSIGTGFNGIVYSLAIDSDGKILVGGGFSSYNGTARNRIIRLNSNGSIDTGFSIGAGFNGDVNSLAIDSDGKIFVGGGFSSYNGTARNCFAILNSDGTLDGAVFNVDSPVHALALG